MGRKERKSDSIRPSVMVKRRILFSSGACLERAINDLLRCLTKDAECVVLVAPSARYCLPY
jgi:hypothetical protein